MPELMQVVSQEDLRRRSSSTSLDLGPYRDIIEQVRSQDGVGGVLTLDEGETQRTEKRRLSVAAKERGLELVWRTAPAGQLRFVLAEPGRPRPGGRPRRPRAERDAEQMAIAAVMTEDVAEVTETAATPVEPEPVAAPRGRGRRRNV